LRQRHKDLTGQRFGELVATTFVPNQRRQGGSEGGWVAECSCGNTRIVRPYLLTSGQQQSCGCVSSKAAGDRLRTHGRTNTFEHNVWIAMRTRCRYKKHPKYHLYGGRGITVCAEWEDFTVFLADMGECPFSAGSIERLDNNKGYEPTNCIWLLKSEQSGNRRSYEHWKERRR
jgi:hypothetical protein